MRWGFNSETDTPSPDLQDLDRDVVADPDFFTDLPCQYEHGPLPGVQRNKLFADPCSVRRAVTFKAIGMPRDRFDFLSKCLKKNRKDTARPAFHLVEVWQGICHG